MEADRYWRRLRGLRANPPRLASKSNERRDVFNAALEQAEQLTRSASNLGSEARPINLFYGLSQGTRAIAAALEPEDGRFRLSNHGIDHEGNLDRSVRNIQVQETERGNGAFTTLARLLRSPGLPEPVHLGDLLAALPFSQPESSWSDRPRTVGVEHVGLGLTLSTDVVAATGTWPLLDRTYTGSIEQSREVLASYLTKHYPGFAGVQPRPEGHAQLKVGDSGMQFNVKIELPDAVGGDGLRQQLLETRFHDVGGVSRAVPRFGNAEEACHPTVVFWAALWTLSMLARYAPVRWAKALNVSKSNDAVALEEILEDSLTMIPWALLDALDAVPDWSSP